MRTYRIKADLKNLLSFSAAVTVRGINSKWVGILILRTIECEKQPAPAPRPLSGSLRNSKQFNPVDSYKNALFAE